MEKLNKLSELVEATKSDYQKFAEKGNNSAGIRVRKKMQEIKSLCLEIRKEIQNTRKESKNEE